MEGMERGIAAAYGFVVHLKSAGEYSLEVHTTLTARWFERAK